MMFAALVAQTSFVRAYGGTGSEGASCVLRTADGGALLAGWTAGFGAGGRDVLLMKLDADANLLWARTLGDTMDDEAFAVAKAADGGILFAGRTLSFGAPGGDALVGKLDAGGNPLWTRAYGGLLWDEWRAILPLPDTGFFLVGTTKSFGAGDRDALVARFDRWGALRWANAYGTPYSETIYAADALGGDIFVAGNSGALSGGSTEPMVARLDTSGALIWSRQVVSGSAQSSAYDVDAAGGSCAITGDTEDWWGPGGLEAFLARFSPDGSLGSAVCFGWTSNECGYAVVSGLIAVAGVTTYQGGNWNAFYAPAPFQRAWVLALPGNDVVTGVVPALGGYALVGYTNSFGAGAEDVLVAVLEGSGTACAGSVLPDSVDAGPFFQVQDPHLTATSVSLSGRAFTFTVTSPTLAETTVCYVSAVTERSPIGATPALTARLVRGGLSISVTSPTGVAVYAADGRLVRRLTVTGTARVTLTPGVYVLRDERGGTLTAAVAR